MKKFIAGFGIAVVITVIVVIIVNIANQPTLDERKVQMVKEQVTNEIVSEYPEVDPDEIAIVVRDRADSDIYDIHAVFLTGMDTKVYEGTAEVGYVDLGF